MQNIRQHTVMSGECCYIVDRSLFAGDCSKIAGEVRAGWARLDNECCSWVTNSSVSQTRCVGISGDCGCELSGWPCPGCNGSGSIRGAFLECAMSDIVMSSLLCDLLCPADSPSGLWCIAECSSVRISPLRALSCSSRLAMLCSFPSHKWHKNACCPLISASLSLPPSAMTSFANLSNTLLDTRQPLPYNFFRFFFEIPIPTEQLQRQHSSIACVYVAHSFICKLLC